MRSCTLDDSSECGRDNHNLMKQRERSQNFGYKPQADRKLSVNNETGSHWDYMSLKSLADRVWTFLDQFLDCKVQNLRSAILCWFKDATQNSPSWTRVQRCQGRNIIFSHVYILTAVRKKPWSIGSSFTKVDARMCSRRCKWCTRSRLRPYDPHRCLTSEPLHIEITSFETSNAFWMLSYNQPLRIRCGSTYLLEAHSACPSLRWDIRCEIFACTPGMIAYLALMVWDISRIELK